MAYYDGTKLLSLKDINGKNPELFLVTTNRTGGKTTWFNRYFVKKFKAGQGKFCLIYRFNYELSDVDCFIQMILCPVSPWRKEYSTNCSSMMSHVAMLLHLTTLTQ